MDQWTKKHFPALRDCGRLERDVSFRSRLTYASQGGRVTALATLSDDDHVVASASDNGSVHVWRVEYVERKPAADASSSSAAAADAASTDDDDGIKGGGGCGGGGNNNSRRGIGSGDGRVRRAPIEERYTGAAEVRQSAAGEGAVTALVRTAPRVLCYATQRGGLHGWDLRARGEAYRVRFPPQLGVITSVVTEVTGGSQAAAAAPGQVPLTSHDPRWLVAGTTAGCLVLVDLRFGVSVAEWRHPDGGGSP